MSLLMWTWLLGAAAASARAECPKLAAVQSAAERYAGLASTPGWRGRARWSAVVPTLIVRIHDDVAWDEATGASRSGPVKRDQGFDVRMSWRLDRLVFDPDEPRLYAAEQRARLARITLRQQVASAYYRWRRAWPLRGNSADAALVADETLAAVDAFTGGWLGRNLCE
ncbi:MAG: hypothetical protein IPL61_22335 [Myxococcales bacterium]|nr:hypothetical protein [Myxococcales bacterium]